MNMNKNKIKYFYINILKKYNYFFLKDIKNYTLKEIEFILNEYLYKIGCKNKIIKFFNYIGLKNKNNYKKQLDFLIDENKKLKIWNNDLLHERNILLLKNDIIDNKQNSDNNKIIFNLKRKINDVEYKNKCLANELSNKNKIIKILLDNEENYIYVNENIKTNMITNKMSMFKLKSILLEKGIWIKNKWKHNLKQEVNRWANHKYERITDKIINLKLKK